jgi:hypothetical protein
VNERLTITEDHPLSAETEMASLFSLREAVRSGGGT